MNLPTKITLARIAMIPILLVFFGLTFLSQMWYIGVTVVFAIASLTDFIDGYLARKNDQVTDLGKFLDPIADKALVVSAMFILLASNVLQRNTITAVLSGIFCTIIVLREFIVSGFRQIAATKSVVLAADFFGKAKTMVTMFALGFMLLAPATASADKIMFYIGFALFSLATLLTIFSGINYFVKNRVLLFGDKENHG